jgi:AbrB family looped-hinge helix DNA binding protein
MISARLTSRGRVTIPKRVRAALRLKAGDRIEFIEVDDPVRPRFLLKILRRKAKRT